MHPLSMMNLHNLLGTEENKCFPISLYFCVIWHDLAFLHSSQDVLFAIQRSKGDACGVDTMSRLEDTVQWAGSQEDTVTHCYVGTRILLLGSRKPWG